jgi:hypothetical protein
MMEQMEMKEHPGALNKANVKHINPIGSKGPNLGFNKLGGGLGLDLGKLNDAMTNEATKNDF